MKVTQEKLPASQIGLEIEITPEMSQQAYEKTLQEFMRSANIPGFRKGKVPRQVLIQRFGSTRIKATVLEELIQSSLQKALEQEEIAAIGSPDLRSSFDELVQQFQPGKPITFSAAVDVTPEATLKQYSGLSIQAEEFVYNPEQVDQVLEDYRKRSATLVPVEDRPAQMGDLARVDFAGRLTAKNVEEGESDEIPGGKAEDFEIELAEGRFIPGFIDGIVGMQPEEVKEVAVTFPEDYPQEDLAGQPALFTITLKELKERELPELDDDFAQEVSEFETLAELRESLETRFQREAEQKTKDSKHEALLKELVEQLEVELPETLIRREVDYAVTQRAMQFSQQGMDVKKMFTPEVVSYLRDQARPSALTRLKQTLALGEIAKQESITVAAEELEAKVAEILPDLEGEEIDTNRLREVVEEDLLREKILDWVASNSSVEMVPEGSLQPDEAAVDSAEAEVEMASMAAPTIGDEPAALAGEESDAIEVVAEVVEESVEAPEVVAESELAVESVETPEPAVVEPVPVPEAEVEESQPTKAKASDKTTTKASPKSPKSESTKKPKK